MLKILMTLLVRKLEDGGFEPGFIADVAHYVKWDRLEVACAPVRHTAIPRVAHAAESSAMTCVLCDQLKIGWLMVKMKLSNSGKILARHEFRHSPTSKTQLRPGR